MADFEAMLLDKLPEVLTEKQRKDKVKNNLQALKTKRLITLTGEEMDSRLNHFF